MNKELRNCKTRESVQKFFEQKNINSFQERYNLLMDEMGSPQTFDIEGTDEQKYEMILMHFLKGSWRYADVLKHLKISIE